MKNLSLTSESFSSGKKHYFIDFNRAVNNRHYLCITRSDQLQDGTYHRSRVVVFEEDFHFLISAMSSLFHSAAFLHQDGFDMRDRYEQKEKGTLKGIKSWDPNLRPRERLISLGAQALSDAELMAILIGAGRANVSAVELSASILRAVGGRLDVLGVQDHSALSRFKGIGPAKSSTILAALELGRRMCAV